MNFFYKNIWKISFSSYLVFLIFAIIVAYIGRIPYTITMIPMYDKICHFLLYGFNSFLGQQAIGNKYIKIYNKKIPTFYFGMVIFSIVEEFFQLLFPNRTFSIFDVLTSLSGITFFYFIYKVKNMNQIQN